MADFGLACHYDKSEPPTDACGSLPSVAPEILTKGMHSPKIDCWSLGIILYELLSSEIPFEHSDSLKFYRNIAHKPLDMKKVASWKNVSANAKDLVIKLL